MSRYSKWIAGIELFPELKEIIGREALTTLKISSGGPEVLYATPHRETSNDYEKWGIVLRKEVSILYGLGIVELDDGDVIEVSEEGRPPGVDVPESVGDCIDRCEIDPDDISYIVKVKREGETLSVTVYTPNKKFREAIRAEREAAKDVLIAEYKAAGGLEVKGAR